MNTYLGDIHIHSVLSPCGDLEMSPVNIVDEAARKGLDIIAVCDHNHLGNAMLTKELGEEKGIWVVLGAEVTTREEVHCLTFFDTEIQLRSFQKFIDDFIPKIQNDTSYFGHQVIVDRNENIKKEIEHSLYPGIDKGINEIEEFVHTLGGLFVPAHVDRKMNGIYAQLGFFPDDLNVDTIEIFRNSSRQKYKDEHPEFEEYQLLKNSDAHFIEDIGRMSSKFLMQTRSFEEFRMALRAQDGRGVIQE
jgi:PHP family Zn ribbon phosphoesterase